MLKKPPIEKSIIALGLLFVVSVGCSGTVPSDTCNGNAAAGMAGTSPCATGGAPSTGGTALIGGTTAAGGASVVGGSGATGGAAGMAAGGCTPATGTMTPYGSYSSPDAFIQGATLDWKDASTMQELQKMHDAYCINTLNVYGLEWISDVDKRSMFSELTRLDMKVVVRIEAYDSSTFAFQVSDLDYIVNYHSALISYVSDSSRRDRVAYFSLNMPVDDSAVQSQLGGINSDLSKERQPVYAAAFVQRMRTLLALNGFTSAKLFLGVFYGWDGSYQLPSYQSANADGYFLNNYSYPVSSTAVPDETDSDSVLINQPRLQDVMTKFESQYSGWPQVLEYGFHTVEYNAGVVPNQTAGLVMTKAAKQKALKATTNYYQSNFLDVRGTLYFGYNKFKSEGTPPAVMDWALVYP